MSDMAFEFKPEAMQGVPVCPKEVSMAIQVPHAR